MNEELNVWLTLYEPEPGHRFFIGVHHTPQGAREHAQNLVRLEGEGNYLYWELEYESETPVHVGTERTAQGLPTGVGRWLASIYQVVE